MTGIRRFDADQNIDLVYMREDPSGIDVEHLTIRSGVKVKRRAA